jgi:hypothetical protein
MLFVLNIVMGAIVVVLLLSGNVGIGLIALLAFAIVALRLGRRDTKQRPATPDQMAAPAVAQPPVATTPAVAPPSDPVAVIASLAALRDSGAITPEEFESKKQELLGRV